MKKKDIKISYIIFFSGMNPYSIFPRVLSRREMSVSVASVGRHFSGDSSDQWERSQGRCVCVSVCPCVRVSVSDSVRVLMCEPWVAWVRKMRPLLWIHRARNIFAESLSRRAREHLSPNSRGFSSSLQSVQQSLQLLYKWVCLHYAPKSS